MYIINISFGHNILNSHLKLQRDLFLDLYILTYIFNILLDAIYIILWCFIKKKEQKNLDLAGYITKSIYSLHL